MPTRRLAKILAIWPVFAFLGFPLFSQQKACSNYLVPLVIRNSQGEIIHDISPGDLAMKLNGRNVTVVAVSQESRNRRVVILLDSSGSMRGIGKEVPWRQAVAAAQMLVTLSEARARVALLVFGSKVEEEIGFSSDNSAVSKRLNELETDPSYVEKGLKGKTHINDAMSRALEMLGQPTSADALFPASDGIENGSRLTNSQIQTKLADSGVRVFAAITSPPEQLGERYRETPESQPQPADIAQFTGGSSMFLNPTGMELGFTAHPKNATEGLRMFFGAMFADQILELSVQDPPKGKADLHLAPSPVSHDLLKTAQFSYPRHLPRCVP